MQVDKLSIEQRRYIGCKTKLASWIFDILKKNINDAHSFCDIFAGTGVVSNYALGIYENVIVNDFLYSNNVIYNAFFGVGEYDESKLLGMISEYNMIEPNDIGDNYFSKNFGGKYFEASISKVIGYVRQDIEYRKNSITEKEYNILLASLIYSIDRLANTLGHFDAYIKKTISYHSFIMRPIDAKSYNGVTIYREDANQLARKIKSDIVYIDPPYNSRQYSRFYHLYETLVKWDNPELFGVALKPKAENMSDYCRTKAPMAFEDLVLNLDTKYIVVSYNNTYKSKSTSSMNCITLEQIKEVLNRRGSTKIYEQKHPCFQAGKTDFKDHKELLFLTKVNEK